MFIHNLNPLLISFGFFEIRWYSLAYIFGILIGWWLGKKIINFKIKNGEINFDIRIFDDLITYIIISMIIGGRTGYVLFYNFLYYLDNPINIFKIWEGGMSFHGALIGVIIGTYIFSNKVKISSLFFLDIVAVVAPIGLFLGRITNFINSELYGKPATVFWSVIFPLIDDIPRHPSQLYEAILEGIFLFVILIFIISRKNTKKGTCSGFFLILYGFFRVLAEQFREPDSHLGYIWESLSMGSVLSLIMILTGILMLLIINKNESYK